MKERPIIFNGEMVRAILAGRKTQTRRVINGAEPGFVFKAFNRVRAYFDYDSGYGSKMWHFDKKCPYGQPGDRLWVREAAQYKRYGGLWEAFDHAEAQVTYVADKISEFYMLVKDDKINFQSAKRPSIHMPRWASRISLDVTSVRVERVQDISEGDAQAEGVSKDCPIGHIPTYEAAPYTYAFSQLWESINAKRGFGWDVNPWVWVVEFKIAEIKEGEGICGT